MLREETRNADYFPTLLRAIMKRTNSLSSLKYSHQNQHLPRRFMPLVRLYSFNIS